MRRISEIKECDKDRRNGRRADRERVTAQVTVIKRER